MSVLSLMFIASNKVDFLLHPIAGINLHLGGVFCIRLLVWIDDYISRWTSSGLVDLTGCYLGL
jgi:hypothetical protein